MLMGIETLDRKTARKLDMKTLSPKGYVEPQGRKHNRGLEVKATPEPVVMFAPKGGINEADLLFLNLCGIAVVDSRGRRLRAKKLG
jgi:hypothetical protein